MVNFFEMSHAEAKQLLKLFLSRMPERLEDLRRRVVADGVASDISELAFSAESLDLVWVWARPQLSWRAGYQPPPENHVGREHPITDLEPADQLPEWFDASVWGWWQFSASTLWLIDALARYFGASILHNVPGTKWKVGRNRRTGYVYQNHPVIAGIPSGDELELMTITTVIISKTLQGREVSLRAAYEAQSRPR